MDSRNKLSLLIFGSLFGLISPFWLKAGQIFTDSLTYYEVTRDTNSIYITVSGTTANPGQWLGLSIYPPRSKLDFMEGYNLVQPLKLGRFQVLFTIPIKFWGGCFDTGIWESKIPLEDIPDPTAFTKLLGYKMKGLLLSKRGCSSVALAYFNQK